MDITALILGIAIGGVIGFLLARVMRSNQETSASGLSSSEVLIAEKGKLEGEVMRLTERIQEYSERVQGLDADNKNLYAERSKLLTENEHLKARLIEQKAELEELQKKFKVEFENLANKIFEEKSQTFTRQNKESLGQVLTPFTERIKSFEDIVRENQKETTKERSTLQEQIRQLTELNNQMLEDAQSLTKALKGDNKAQGNWGEFILERILEESGLQKDREYITQHSDTNQEGSLVRPDVVVKLPDDKHIIVDSKVSLVGYEKSVNADTEEERSVALKEHVLSVKAHVKSLSEKNYDTALGLNSPEFVLLFIPVEPGFAAALKADNELYKYAWERKVIIVSPSTLLATLRTIASVWKQERQTRNALEIARQAGSLYDKFVGFLEDLATIKKRLDQGQDAYTAAYNKLKTGRGNLIKKTEDLKKLGAQTSKRIPSEFLDESEELDTLNE